MLKYHINDSKKIQKIINSFTTESYSHLHMICRQEAIEILGEEIVECSSEELSERLDILLRAYEVHFKMRSDFFLNAFIDNEREKTVRFIGGAIESTSWSYLYETHTKIKQTSKIPQNIQLQVPSGQEIPLIPGLPRDINFDITSQGWMRNEKPRGFTK